MKEQFIDDNGVKWTFSHWRIAPPGHPLPHPMLGFDSIPPEGIFVNEVGDKMGLSPNNPHIGKFDYEPSHVIYQAPEKQKNAKTRRQEDRSRRFGR